MKSAHINISLSPHEYEKSDEVSQYLGIPKSKLFKVVVDYIYQKEIAKKEHPLAGLMEKYHVTASTLGIITNTNLKDFEHAALSEFYGGKDNG